MKHRLSIRGGSKRGVDAFHAPGFHIYYPIFSCIISSSSLEVIMPECSCRISCVFDVFWMIMLCYVVFMNKNYFYLYISLGTPETESNFVNFRWNFVLNLLLVNVTFKKCDVYNINHHKFHNVYYCHFLYFWFKCFEISSWKSVFMFRKIDFNLLEILKIIENINLIYQLCRLVNFNIYI